MNINSSSQCKA